ncbi:MAG: hypothetical protein JWQ10_3734 [Herbaspirillum sp.]|nr:hypothetical protein [Herbaspirillum sp.]
MKTSLVSPFAEVAAAALSKPVTVKADQPQQLQSVTVYWRGRKMVLMQRPQRRLSALLCRMLRRSWQNLFGGLTRAIGIGAMAAAVLMAPAHAGVANTLPVNTLPTPVSQNPVQSGAASITQAGNQMTVKQTSDKAIIDWQSFSIGSSAGVNFLQNNANSVALNRVIGNDPSIIMGSLTANGKIFLINAAGILVGKTGKIDVASFTASTLNISDADFLAGKMNFAADTGKTIGNVTNRGAITSADGGSVYLIGANVKNAGIITSPDGEVLLAAGSSVQLVDTSLPGVTINVGGIDGKVTNLGQIIASAGTIGIGAALIDNSGIINASSVEKQGGRIFLRATKQLTTDATSKINADGITGGNVQLYSDQVANIDGDVSALGSAGNGGYVDTSGKTVLSVQYVPRVGPGGTWFIDPSDVEIISGASTGVTTSGGAITAVGDSAQIDPSTITTLLEAGTNVTISTGADVSTQGQLGNITVSASIIESTGSFATLTLNAANNIIITSIIDGGSTGMNLVLDAGGSVTQTTAGTIIGNGLSVFAGTGIALADTSNNVQSFNARNGAGDIVFTNRSPTDLSLGSVVNLNGNITISNRLSALSTTGTISATGAVSLDTLGSLTVGNIIAAQNIRLNTQVASDVILGGNLTATGVGGTVTITSSNNILQSGGVITAAGLNATAYSNIDLTSSNSVGSFAAQSSTGHINLLNTGNISLGAISAAAVGITATSGKITQSANISAVSLNVTAANGITLNNATNAVGTFAANNTASGDISFATSGTQLTLHTINNGSATGNITLTAQDAAITSNGGITTSGGNLTVSSASFDNFSMLSVNGGTASFSSDLHNTGCGTIAGTGTINFTGVTGDSTLINDGVIQISTGEGFTAGNSLIIGGNYQQNGGGRLQVKVNRIASSALQSDQLKVTGNVSLAGTLNISSSGEYAGLPGDKVAIVNYGGTRTGAFTVINGLPMAGNLFPNYLLPISVSGHDISLAYAPAGSNYFTGAQGLDWSTDGNWFSGFVPLSSADVYIDTGSGNTVTHATAVDSAIQALTIASGGLDVSNGSLAVAGIATVNGSLSASGTGVLTLNSDATVNGSLSASGTSTLQLYGNTTINGSFATSDTASLYIGYLGALSGSTLGINGGNLTVDGSIDAGAGDLFIGALGTLAVNSSGSISGKSVSLTTTGPTHDINIFGSVTATGTGTDGINNNGAVTLNSAGAISTLDTHSEISSYGVINGGALSATADGTIDLSGTNSISGFTAHSVSGDIALNNSGDLNVNNVTATSGSVTLNSTGAITQNTDASAGITTAQLRVNAVNGITLNSSGNNVSALSAFNSSGGDIALTNASTVLMLSGNIENDAVGGNATIINRGDIIATANQDGDFINGTDVNGAVTFTSTAGNVTLGRVNTSNLIVNAAGAISQESTKTGGLTVTGTMTATANTGIKLDNGNATCGTNHVANFSARNNGTGDITLVNTDFPTDLVQVNNKLVSIHNAGGNISVENTGGMTTVGLIDALAGSVHLFTHSPLIIGAGGISAGNGVTLAAGTSGSPGDVLTLNGVIQTVSGNLAFAGNTVLPNAAIYGPNAPAFSSPNPVVFGSNYVYAKSPPNLTPVNLPIVLPVSATNTLDQNISHTTNNENNNNTDAMLPVTAAMTTTTQTKTSTDQTIGGSDGEFGGSDTKDDKKDTTAKSNKPLPVCT